MARAPAAIFFVKGRTVKVSLVQKSANMKRALRSPQHPFNLRVQPWQVQPCFIAPVVPGETMKNLMLMSRIVSDPIKDKLMGWWAEYYFFYVKHRDLSVRDQLVQMHLNQAYDTTAIKSAASARYFHNGGINYTKYCLDSVLEWYFRDEGEAAPALIDTMPPVKINHDGWWQSLKKESQLPANDHELPGDNPVIPDGVPAGFEAQFAQWEAMRAAGITIATFEDYLASFGVKAAKDVDEEVHRPELIRYVRDFTYPTNTVEPTTGTPSSAAVWSISERADKDRFFSEPGFLFGVQVVRPKVYLNNITGSVTSYMDKAFNWMPALLRDMAFMSLKEFATATGPAPVAFGEDYWIDLKDLFLYGEQFTNHTDQKNTVALPDAAGNHKYPTEAMAAALFSAGATKYLRSDGIVTLNIASPVHGDTST